MAAKHQRTAAEYIPPRAGLKQLREIARRCQACDLYKRGTQTVFGEGASRARVVLVGEQPGDKEDLTGHPFVGPAGRILDKALLEAGIDRSETYVTNIVKHFKWEPRGKRRIHKKPNSIEINACRPWFDAEVQSLKPDVIICLGATAAQAILGRDFRVTQRRGELMEVPGVAPAVIATVHPSAILRAPDDQSRHREYDRFLQDVMKAARYIHRQRAA